MSLLNNVVGFIGAAVLFVTGLAAFLGVCLAIRAACESGGNETEDETEE